MSTSWKLIVAGGLVYYATTFAVSLAAGPVIHTAILDPIYDEHQQFWLPELRSEPPDLAALMPRWIASGLINGLVLAALYGTLREAFAGPGWRRGLLYGGALGLIYGTLMLAWSGIFDLPGTIWIWWVVEGFLYNLTGGAALGFVAQKVAPLVPPE